MVKNYKEEERKTRIAQKLEYPHEEANPPKKLPN